MGQKKREGRTYTLTTKKRLSNLNLAKVSIINFKDVLLLESFVTEKGKIIPGRTTSINAKQQGLITKAIKLARNIALLSFSKGFVDPNPIATLQLTNKYSKYVSRTDDAALLTSKEEVLIEKDELGIDVIVDSVKIDEKTAN